MRHYFLFARGCKARLQTDAHQYLLAFTANLVVAAAAIVLATTTRLFVRIQTGDFIPVNLQTRVGQ